MVICAVECLLVLSQHLRIVRDVDLVRNPRLGKYVALEYVQKRDAYAWGHRPLTDRTRLTCDGRATKGNKSA
jgi:hypothetical protein